MLRPVYLNNTFGQSSQLVMAILQPAMPPPAQPLSANGGLDRTVTGPGTGGDAGAAASASAAAAAALGSAPAADRKPARSRKPSAAKPPAPVLLPPVADDPFELPSAAIKAKEAAVDSEVEKERVRGSSDSCRK